MRESLITPRNVLAATGAVLALDQVAGLIYRQTMTDVPSVEVEINPDSDRTTIVAGGMGNDGIALGRCIGDSYLLNIGSVLSLRYAQTNIDSEQIVDHVTGAIDYHGLEDDRFDVYLGSAAGVIMAKPLSELAKHFHLGTVILDGCPFNSDDVKRPLRDLLKTRFEVLKHSRILNHLASIATDLYMPPLGDRERDISLERAEAARSAIVRADLITLGIQAAAIRDDLEPGLFTITAEDGQSFKTVEEFVYVHSKGEDPIIDNNSAIDRWRAFVDPVVVREAEDTDRPVNSHAAGASYPRGIVNILQGYL